MRAHLLTDQRGHTNPTRVGQCLRTGCDVQTVAVARVPSYITSPRLTPMRKRLWRDGGLATLRSAIVRWMAMAHSTACWTLGTLRECRPRRCPGPALVHFLKSCCVKAFAGSATAASVASGAGLEPGAPRRMPKHSCGDALEG